MYSYRTTSVIVSVIVEYNCGFHSDVAYPVLVSRICDYHQSTRQNPLQSFCFSKPFDANPSKRPAWILGRGICRCFEIFPTERLQMMLYSTNKEYPSYIFTRSVHVLIEANDASDVPAVTLLLRILRRGRGRGSRGA